MIGIDNAWTHYQIDWLENLVEKHKAIIDRRCSHGDLNRWLKQLKKIPTIPSTPMNLGREVGLTVIPSDLEIDLNSALRGLMPWRKGPFRFGRILIDAEWRSDLKWDRLAPHLDLRNHSILDIGSGNGYHLWRMLEAGAKQVLGIDPNILFNCQFAAVKSLLGQPKAASIPVTLEEFDAGNLRFDSVFSMGVLYHRKSPVKHIEQAKKWIAPGGQFFLETLIIEKNGNTTLTPSDRYTRMNNVWFLPSIDCLICWLDRLGFTDIICLDIAPTTNKEQRKTPWMQFESLEHGLNPNDPELTIEGLPRPIRAILRAKIPY